MAYEDFTTFTEIDVNNRITVVDSDTVLHTATRNETTYLYKDYTPAHFTNYDYLIDCESDFQDTYCNGSIWLLANALGDRKALETASETHDHIEMSEALGPVYRIIVRHWALGVNNYDIYLCAVSTRYYLRITRVKATTTLTVKIYSDSARLNLLDTLAVVCDTTDFRYLYACCSYNSAQAGRDSHNIIEYLDLQETTPTATDKNIPTFNNSKFITHH